MANWDAAATVTGINTISATANMQWAAKANITGIATISTGAGGTYWAASAHIIGRSLGSANADQPAPPAPLSPYGGLST